MNWTPTHRDRKALVALARHGALNMRFITDRYYGGVAGSASRSVGKMLRAGFVAKDDQRRWAGTVVWPTTKGQNLARAFNGGIPLPQKSAGWPSDRLLHRLVQAEVVASFEDAGRRMITERELRAAESHPARAHETAHHLGLTAVAEPDNDGARRLFAVPTLTGVHYPDAAIIRADGAMIAVEIEITPKGRRDLLRVLRGYRDSKLYTQVLYVVTAPVAAQMHGQRQPNGTWRNGILNDLDYLAPGEASNREAGST